MVIIEHALLLASSGLACTSQASIEMLKLCSSHVSLLYAHLYGEYTFLGPITSISIGQAKPKKVPH